MTDKPPRKKQVVVAALVCLIVVALAGMTYITNSHSTAELVLRVIRPDNMELAEFEDYRRAQRKLIVSDYVLRLAVEDPLVARTTFVLRRKDPVSAMSHAIKSVSKEADLISVTFRCRDVEEAKTILNEVVDEYLTDVVVEARVQREQLLYSVQRTHDRLAESIKKHRQIEADAAEALEREVMRLDAWHSELVNLRSSETDETRIGQLDAAIRFAKNPFAYDPQARNMAIPEMIAEALVKLRKDVARWENRLEELAEDLADWHSHTVPRIRVIQHAEAIDSES